MKMTNYEELVWRGLIKDESSPEIKDLINGKGFSFYWGTDPSADSLHIGHYSSLVMAKRLMKMGHHPILLVGGATGLIGDPRPTAERALISYESVQKNIEGIRSQIDRLLEGKAKLVNNYDWTKDVTFLDFLRDIGKYINVNYMLDKDIIRRRLETGITYAEFSYTLIQGNDFVELFKRENCIMQVAGSDQWGNITTGIELIKKLLNKEAYGFTMPLILDKNGNKFGKSEGNALWLDKTKTKPFDIYQYLINSDDTKVIEYLKVFTFLTPDEIMALEDSVKNEPEKREAQKALAYEVIKDLHGEEEAKSCVSMAESLFSNKGNRDMVDTKEIDSKEIGDGIKITDFLFLTGMFESKSDARRMVEGNGVSLNDEKVTDVNMIITKDSFKDNAILVQKGKKNFLKMILK